MPIAPVSMSAGELLEYDAHHHRTELVHGQLVVREPAGGDHAAVLIQLATAIELCVRSTSPRIGRVLGGDPGFWLAQNPDTVRAPDLAFVRADRLPDGPGPGFLRTVPDLAVDIRSPSDRAGADLQKVGDWLEAGCSLVWVVDPSRQAAQMYHADGSVDLLENGDALDGAPVLTGLRVPMESLW